jgi:hypothetical protein
LEGYQDVSVVYTEHELSCRLRDLLKPFAIATNAAQSDHCCLDTILLLLGYLYHIHNNTRINGRIRSAIHNSLEKRWKKVDQYIFILAVVLNPYIRKRAFRAGSHFGQRLIYFRSPPKFSSGFTERLLMGSFVRPFPSICQALECGQMSGCLWSISGKMLMNR